MRRTKPRSVFTNVSALRSPATCARSDTSSIVGWTWFSCSAGLCPGKLPGKMPQTFPPVTRAIIILNVLVYLLQQVYGGALENLFALWPVSAPQFEPWQLLTYG